MIKIGDTVKIIHMGALYSSFDEMAKILGATKWAEGYHDDAKGCIGVIRKIKKQPPDGSHKHWFLVDMGNYEMIIGDKGITKVLEWDE